MSSSLISLLPPVDDEILLLLHSGGKRIIPKNFSYRTIAWHMCKSSPLSGKTSSLQLKNLLSMLLISSQKKQKIDCEYC